MCGFCNVWMCVYVGFVMCWCVYARIFKCVGVCVCGFCNVWLCVSLGFVMCGFYNVWVCMYVWSL